jgi:hypothetical protein
MADEKGPADESRTHAREAPETVADRVTHIAGMMERFEWNGRQSLRELSVAWGVAESTVKNYSAEASRLVTGDVDEARRDITVGARKLLREAVTAGDANGFRQVADIWASVSGAKAPEKHQVGVLDNATPGKAREVMAELFGSVTPSGKTDGDGSSDPSR